MVNRLGFKIEKSDSEGFSIGFQSASEDMENGYFFITAFGYWIERKTDIIKPYKTKVYPTTWDQETKDRLGRDWYWEVIPRRYSVSLYDNHFSVYYGVDTGSSLTTKQFGFFLPWREWRFIRRTIYNKDDSVFWEQNGQARIDEKVGSYEASQSVPKYVFDIYDFDGEEITASCYVEEYEWHKGAGWFNFLSLFYKSKIRRSLSINFDKGTGPRKGSWKGGTLGHGIDMDKGESVANAFARYCVKYNMTVR